MCNVRHVCLGSVVDSQKESLHLRFVIRQESVLAMVTGVVKLIGTLL